MTPNHFTEMGDGTLLALQRMDVHERIMDSFEIDSTEGTVMVYRHEQGVPKFSDGVGTKIFFDGRCFGPRKMEMTGTMDSDGDGLIRSKSLKNGNTLYFSCLT